MILAKLVDYYHRLANQADTDSGSPKVPTYGFSEEKIAYILVLNTNGDLLDCISHLTDDKKPQAKLMSVPQSFKRSGTTPKPFFLWDKTAYVLGVESNKDKTSAKAQPFMLSEKTFTAFQQYHLNLLQESEDEGLRAVYAFLKKWQPEKFADAILSKEILDANLVFKLDNTHGYIHERPAAKALWANLLKIEDAEQGLCLVTGQNAPIARLHPAIKGVSGGQSSGGSIISFNKKSFESYGKTQGANAPVSEQAAFAYTTALNYLLRNNKHTIHIGDTSIVFWAEAETTEQANFAEDIFLHALENNDDDDTQATNKIFEILKQVQKGRPLTQIHPQLSENTRFYILGLAPNEARISIRFWLDTHFGELLKNLANHLMDLTIEPRPWKNQPSAWRLVSETAIKFKKKDGSGYELPKMKNISPILVGEMMRAILNDTPYPASLMSQLLTRIRADGDINGWRVAMIKAILHRKFRKNLITEGVTMSLNPENENIAYLMGRLFAVLERIQNQALGDVNAGIADRYYGSASAIPFSVFPRLLSGSKHHLSRLRKDKAGMAINLDKDLGEIINKLPETFPRHLSIDEQGRFAIGYYHQKQHYFTKKEPTPQQE